MTTRAAYLERELEDPWADADPDAQFTIPPISLKVRALHCPGCGEVVDHCVCPDLYGDLRTTDEQEEL